MPIGNQGKIPGDQAVFFTLVRATPAKENQSVGSGIESFIVIPCLCLVAVSMYSGICYCSEVALDLSFRFQSTAEMREDPEKLLSSAE
jgi:hypothetical protein